MDKDNFREGLSKLIKNTEDALAELDRIARVSFELEISRKISEMGLTEELVLTHKPEYSRNKTPRPGYILGTLTFTKNYCNNPLIHSGLYCPRDSLRAIGQRLERIIKCYETPQGENWHEEAYNGEALAIWLPYFQSLQDSKGRIAPLGTTVYKTGDERSKLLIKRLTE
ncbi:hypothetical protein D6825_01535 [Candidatus Woesearchaeota archaeon]|nr:MAG: hypothetical protein D6825_01535 [Candidatus Woesearchaeota archaeon]